MFGQRETGPGTHDLTGNCRIVVGFRCLTLVRIDDDQVHEMAGNPHIMRAQGTGRGHALDLRNDEAAMVADRNRLFEAAQIGALMFIGQVATFVCRGGANDGNVRNDVREVQPGLAIEFLPRHNRFFGSDRIHCAALADWVDKRVETDLGQHARPVRCRVPVHVEQDAGWHVIGSHPVLDEHLPDLGHRHRRRA